MVGVDAVDLFARAVTESGGVASEGVIRYLNAQSKYPGLFGDYGWSPTQHNGYPTEEIVMGLANSSRNGALKLAPGYA